MQSEKHFELCVLHFEPRILRFALIVGLFWMKLSGESLLSHIVKRRFFVQQMVIMLCKAVGFVADVLQ